MFEHLSLSGDLKGFQINKHVFKCNDPKYDGFIHDDLHNIYSENKLFCSLLQTIYSTRLSYKYFDLFRVYSILYDSSMRNIVFADQTWLQTPELYIYDTPIPIMADR
ncbi:hypothetical protein RF11_12993 [Thelohanellus kitauei]|uniref:Uncharacterized protein n=1 Tax=Thelohanellus kitauei TaxID=669202 RepID=A0A0C2N5D4_THEKT|nr:hypothetical protein RF11_12993 [Thelohanellus kitauei]